MHIPVPVTQKIPILFPPSLYSSSDKPGLKIPLSSFSTMLPPTPDGAEREARTISHVVSTEGARLVRSDSSLFSVDENDNDDNDDDEKDDDDNDGDNFNDDDDYGGDNDNENNDNNNNNNNGDDDGDDNNDDNDNNNGGDDGDDDYDNDYDNDPDSSNDEGLPNMRISSNVPLMGICMKVHTTSEHEQIADRPKNAFSTNLPKVCPVL